MPNYKGRRPGTRRIRICLRGQVQEWIIEGSKADGDKFEARKRIELQDKPREHRTAVTFSRLCEAYALHAKTHLKESTWQKVRIYQVATLVEHLGKIPIDEFTGADVNQYKLFRLAPKDAPRRNASPTSVNNELRVLSAIFTWGRKAGYLIPVVQWDKVPVRKSDRVKYWTRAELDLIFDATRKLYPELLPMFVFLLNTGTRKGEALAAEWSWIDTDRDLVTIPATDVWQPKNGRSRDVPLADAVKAVLSGPRKHPTVVFPSKLGRRYTDFPKDCFWAILKAAGVRGNPHMFRHTFASNFLESIPDMKLLGEILGHSTTRVTEIYAHLLPGRLDRAKNAVNLSPKIVAAIVAAPKRLRK